MAASVVERAREEFFELLDQHWRQAGLSDACASPIERLLLFALAAEALRIGEGLRVAPEQQLYLDLPSRALRRTWPAVVGSGQQQHEGPAILDWVAGVRSLCSFDIFKQVAIAQYRADFVVQYHFAHGAGPPYEHKTLVVVECDGHSFHERTKEQARHDRSRDRFMTQSGLQLFRFTGSELHANPRAAAQQIISLLCPHADEAFKSADRRGELQFDDWEADLLHEVG